MQTWETYQKAALEYSKYRPRRRVTTITSEADTQEYELPDDFLTALDVRWGDATEAIPEVAFVELMSAGDSTETGWTVEGNLLYITPIPDADTSIKVVYYARHMPSLVQTFPTIPAGDLHYVDDLEQAIVLETSADTASGGGAISYSIGQTTVSRKDGISQQTSRAESLRKAVVAALEEPMALWQ